METNETFQYCKSCGQDGAGKFCSNCGQSYNVKRITLKALLHDVFHFFTHLEKGFGYTLKRLIVTPGTMQREYVEGKRSRYQKPFSMFFICASINAVTRFWVEEAMIKYMHEGSEAVASLRHEYQLFLLLLLVPVVVFVMWALVFRKPYNFAETGVQQLYLLSVVLLVSTLASCLRFIWPALDTAFIEFPLFAVYAVVTHIRFYYTSRPWVVAIKSIVLMSLFFLCIQYLEDLTIAWIKSGK